MGEKQSTDAAGTANGRVYTGRQVADAFEQIAPLNTGVPNDQLGFLFGDPAQAASGVGCMWAVDLRAIGTCIEQGLNFILCHEAPWLPEQKSPWYDGPAGDEIFSNRARRELLEKHRMVVYRSHSNWDVLAVDGVADQAVAALPLKGLRGVARQRFFSVQELPEPMSVRKLTSRVEHGLGMPGCRIWGNPWQQVRRFAFLIGGFGSNQWNIPQAARQLGAEVVIIGEMTEQLVVGALEQGLVVIQTLHSASEIPGIRRQAEVLAARLPGISVRYVPSGLLAFQGKRPTNGGGASAGHASGHPGHGQSHR
jgi:putative NIF3 family GTP cyclohydrolase 1 type 2